MCVCVCVRACVRACVRVYASDKLLYYLLFGQTLIIVKIKTLKTLGGKSLPYLI